MQVLPGFGQTINGLSVIRYGNLNPLTVFLTGSAPEGLAQLQVSVTQNDQSIVYLHQVTLPGGAVNQAVNFTIPLYTHDTFSGFRLTSSTPKITVNLIMNGNQLVPKQNINIPTILNRSSFNILILDQKPVHLHFLIQHNLDLYHLHTEGSDPNNSYISQNLQSNISTIQCDSRALPVDPAAYLPIDAIVIGNTQLSQLTDAQEYALRNYVALGGLVIVSGGCSIHHLQSSILTGLLPVTPESTSLVQTCSPLTNRYSSSPSSPSGFENVQSTLKQNATLLLGSTKQPLVASVPYGNGVVLFTSFDILSPQFRQWKAASFLWRDLLLCQNRYISSQSLLSSTNLSQLSNALAGPLASRLPPASWLILFSVIYLLLLVPTNYIVLKKLDRKELGWITVPLLIAGFTIGAYWMGSMLKNGPLAANSIAVIETQANTSKASGYLVSSVYSPQSANYKISLGNQDADNNPFRYSTITQPDTDQTTPQSYLVNADSGSASISNFSIPLWDARDLSSHFVINMPPLSAKLVLSKSGKRMVEVTNTTGFALHNCQIINTSVMGGQSESIQPNSLTIAPGQTLLLKYHAVGKLVSALNIPNLVNIPNFNIYRNNPASIKKHITGAFYNALMNSNSQDNFLAQYMSGGSSGYQDMELIGQIDNPVSYVTVNGKKVGGIEIDILCVHLQPAASNLGLNPFSKKPVLNYSSSTVH